MLLALYQNVGSLHRYIVFVQLGYVHRYIVIYYQHVGMYNITMECTYMDLYTYIECTIS